MQLQELANLSSTARLQAMELLWQSFANDADQHLRVVPAWHQQVLDDRLAKLQAGLEPSKDWADAKEALRAMTRQTA